MARRITKSVQASTTRRINLQVDESAHELLLIHAHKTRRSMGELVSHLAHEHCREWHVRSNPRKDRDGDSNRLELVGPVMETAAA